MTRSRKKSTPKTPPPAAQPPMAAARHWLLAAFTAVCVARPLVPSEGSAWLGDGLPFTMVLLIVAVGYLALAVRQGRFASRFHITDAAVAALVLVCMASALSCVLTTLFPLGGAGQVTGRVCSPRPTLNMFWEWLGLGLVYFLARQLLRTPLENRVLAAAMIALAVALSAYGLYQVSIELPAERAAYAADPDGMLRELGQWYPPGSPERALFEDRLASTEPLATFALTNSLAGVLAPWLIVLLGVGWNVLQTRFAAPVGSARGRLDWPALLRGGGLLVCIAALMTCFVLSKSRSAYVALAVGLVVLPFSLDSFRRLFSWRVLAALGGALAIAIGAAVATGTLDAELLTEASKSFEYRLQYWQATLDMIAEHPALGVSPGNFQNYYTQYKLPEASEEIRDPHNFLLETWATGGTLAFFALVTVLGAFVWQTWEAADDNGDTHALDPSAGDAVRLALAGAAAGALFAFFIGTPFGFAMSLAKMLGILAIGSGVVAVLWPWIQRGALPRWLPAVALLVLCIHLLAAGGFTFAGVAGTFWLLLALGVNATTDVPPAGAPARPRRLAPAIALAVAAALAVGCYFTALLPVLKQKELMARAADPRLSDERRIELLTEAAGADPLSSEPWEAIGEISRTHLKEQPHSELWGSRFVRAATSIVSLRGHSSAAWRQVAAWYQEQYDVDSNPNLADDVVRVARSAADLYPNSADVQGRYAVALSQVGEMDAARETAARALELDALTPHADKKLSAELKAKLQQLIANQSDADNNAPSDNDAPPAPTSAGDPTPASPDVVK